MITIQEKVRSAFKSIDDYWAKQKLTSSDQCLTRDDQGNFKGCPNHL